MNQISQYMFNIYHYLLNLRDTLEYTIDREHAKNLYDQRKMVLTKGIEEGSALGNFFKNNKEQGDKIIKNLKEFVEEVYGDTSTVLVVTGDKIRVDHTQNQKIYEYITGLSEQIRDILYGYINYARQQNQLEDIIVKLLAEDDRLYRSVLAMLVMRDFEKSFFEFQKVMGEAGGKQTPQSNFIVQNEIMKMAGQLRFSKQHHHTTETQTLELLDKVDAVIEMTEGRRDRKDNKSFKDIFDELNKELAANVARVEPSWKETFNNAFKDMMESQNKGNPQA